MIISEMMELYDMGVSNYKILAEFWNKGNMKMILNFASQVPTNVMLRFELNISIIIQVHKYDVSISLGYQ